MPFSLAQAKCFVPTQSQNSSLPLPRSKRENLDFYFVIGWQNSCVCSRVFFYSGTVYMRKKVTQRQRSLPFLLLSVVVFTEKYSVFSGFSKQKFCLWTCERNLGVTRQRLRWVVQTGWLYEVCFKPPCIDGLVSQIKSSFLSKGNA